MTAIIKNMEQLTRMDKIINISYQGNQHGAVAEGPMQMATLPVRFLHLDNFSQKGAAFTKVVVITAIGRTAAINCYPGTQFTIVHSS